MRWLLQCINCAACSNFAPETFSRSPEDSYHVVHRQPSTDSEIQQARAALAACPVAAIRVETLAERRHRATDKTAVEESWSNTDNALVGQMSIATNKPFPKAFLVDSDDDDNVPVPGVYWTGHHNEASFGATPYLVQAKFDGRDVWIMVDTPKYSKSSVQAVTSLTGPEGPDYLFLTHVDDTADHGKWADAFEDLQRIFHAGDLGRHNWIGDTTLQDVEILLPSSSSTETMSGLVAFALDGTPVSLESWMAEKEASSNVIILHTPGHSPGSMTLFRRPNSSNDEPGLLFTGDTYGYTTRDAGHMTGFPRYGNNLRQQSENLERLLELLDWQVIAPGHGHPRDYQNVKDADNVRRQEMKQALEEMTLYSR
jgi:glyoxylase-like metal-dependent hydrolase (beta-lactamase superfamily II)/ferredoxin